MDMVSSPVLERRSARRAPVSLYVNQYIDGVPCLCEVIELSMTGMLLRRVLGPNTQRATYAVEMGKRGRKTGALWLCATPIWQSEAYEALSFVASSPMDKLKLADLMESLRGSQAP